MQKEAMPTSTGVECRAQEIITNPPDFLLFHPQESTFREIPTFLEKKFLLTKELEQKSFDE
jgi:hypothetical protein